jgi:hypothetical protein
MLLSPGTVISVSIRGARFIRNSIESVTNCARARGVTGRAAREDQHPVQAADVQPSCMASAQSHKRSSALRSCRELGNEEDFFVVRVRILHFRAGRHTTHVDNFTGDIRAGDQTCFTGYWDSVRIISLGRFDWRSRRSWRRQSFSGGFRLDGTVWIEWLLLRRTGRLWLRRVPCDTLADARRRFLDSITR